MKKILLVAFSIPLAFAGGFMFGTGGGPGETSDDIREYKFPNGDLMRRDYHNSFGDLCRSRWFLPSKTVLAESVFENGNGIELYLHDNGSIKKIVFIQDGVANGLGVSFSKDGVATKQLVYKGGVKEAEMNLIVQSKEE